VTYLLVAMLVAQVLPLLTSSWRISLVGLGAQGLLMTAMVSHRGWPATASGAVLLLDLLVLRTWFVPRHLVAIMRSTAGSRRADVIPANLLSWAMAGAVVFVAFRFAGLVEPAGGAAAMHVAVASAGLLLGLLILGSQAGLFGQVVGLLRLEYAVALLEVGGGHEVALPVQLGLSVVLLLSVLTLGGFLRRMGAAPTAPPPVEEATP
jgi:hydrogenase-4 membrane subunit HyfE